ncbi:MAG: 30S ribosomal protein S3 [bacterium]
MGQKVHPKAYRLGYLYSWNSKWFSGKNYAVYLEQDTKVKKFLLKKLKDAAISKIEVERSPQEIIYNIYSSRPGLIIGRGGGGIEDLKKEINKILPSSKTQIKINIQEVRQPLLDAKLVGIMAAEQIEKRMPFRRVMKQMAGKVIEAGAKGVKIMIAGRLDGAEMSRREWIVEGSIPLQTLRADIDFNRTNAYTTYGVVGIKIWIYKGEVFNADEKRLEGIKKEEKK